MKKNAILMLVLIFLNLISFSQNNKEKASLNNKKITKIESRNETGFKIFVQDVEKQTFKLNANKDTLIFGTEGTLIFIPSNCFVLPDGNLPKGEILIELKEYYSTTDIILAGLTITADNKILETAGMINITAKADGKELEVAKGKKLIYHFPKKEENKNTRLFYSKMENLKINCNLYNKKQSYIRGYTLIPITNGVDLWIDLKFNEKNKEYYKGLHGHIINNIEWTEKDIYDLACFGSDIVLEYRYDFKNNYLPKAINGLNKDFDNRFLLMMYSYMN